VKLAKLLVGATDLPLVLVEADPDDVIALALVVERTFFNGALGDCAVHLHLEELGSVLKSEPVLTGLDVVDDNLVGVNGVAEFALRGGGIHEALGQKLEVRKFGSCRLGIGFMLLQGLGQHAARCVRRLYFFFQS